MKNIFLDTNILLDLILGRQVEKTGISELLPEIPGKYIYLSTLSVHITYYILKVRAGSSLDRKIKDFLRHINLVPLNEAVIWQALDSDFRDFEDVLQYICAMDTCEYLLTRNKKDFVKIQKNMPAPLSIITHLDEVPELHELVQTKN